MKKVSYWMQLGLIGVSVDRVEYDKSINTLWLYAGDCLLAGIALSRYGIRFTMEKDDVKYYEIFRK